jgi:hypothetical protein
MPTPTKHDGTRTVPTGWRLELGEQIDSKTSADEKKRYRSEHTKFTDTQRQQRSVIY